MEDLYAVLGLERTASSEEIRSRYIKLVLESHPDRNPDNPGAEEMFKTISAAYSILGDSKNRQIYDSKLRINRDLFRQDKEENYYERNYYWQEFLRRSNEFNKNNGAKYNAQKPNQAYQNKQTKKEALTTSYLHNLADLTQTKRSLEEPTKDLRNSLLTLLSSPLIYAGLEMGANSDSGDDGVVLGISLVLAGIGAVGTTIYSSIRSRIKGQIKDLERTQETLVELIKQEERKP